MERCPPLVDVHVGGRGVSGAVYCSRTQRLPVLRDYYCCRPINRVCLNDDTTGTTSFFYLIYIFWRMLLKILCSLPTPIFFCVC